MNIARQRDIDHLTQRLWAAKVWMNLQRRARAKQKPTDDIPPLLRKTLRRA